MCMCQLGIYFIVLTPKQETRFQANISWKLTTDILNTTNMSCTELALLKKNIETNLVEINRGEMVLYGDFVPGDFSGVEEFILILQRKWIMFSLYIYDTLYTPLMKKQNYVRQYNVHIASCLSLLSCESV